MRKETSDTKRHEYKFYIKIIREQVDTSAGIVDEYEERILDPQLLRNALMARAKEINLEQKEKLNAAELSRQLELGIDHRQTSFKKQTF